MLLKWAGRNREQSDNCKWSSRFLSSPRTYLEFLFWKSKHVSFSYWQILYAVYLRVLCMRRVLFFRYNLQVKIRRKCSIKFGRKRSVIELHVNIECSLNISVATDSTLFLLLLFILFKARFINNFAAHI